MNPAWLPYDAAFPGPDHTMTGDAWANVDPTHDRAVVVHLPPSYPHTEGVHPTVYMMDGQNLFDEVRSHGREWGVDETMHGLAATGVEAIIVAVDNGGARRTEEYSPFAVPGDGGGGADDFLEYLTETVMPDVAENFRVSTARTDTFVLGSSLGGLFSLYALYERADVFGGAGVMSPALWHGDHAIFEHLGRRPAAHGRVYVDVGTRELSGRYSALKLHSNSRRFRDAARRLHRELLRKEPDPSALRYVEARRAPHSPTEWGRRFPGALRFLLGGEAPRH